MIKVKTNHKELRYFNQYLDESLKRPRTEFELYEFLLAENIEALAADIKKKVAVFILEKREDHAAATLKIEYRELAALCVYLNRFQIYPFLIHLQNAILKQVPTEIINVCSTIPIYNPNENNQIHTEEN